MRRLVLLGVLGLLFLEFQGEIPAKDAEDIGQAVERGIAALRRRQNVVVPGQDVGTLALISLTLLECEIPANDPGMQTAIAAIRTQCISTNKTYNLALCILFFDRLGDPEDVPLIESLTVRLLAGQGRTGGFSYTCPEIPPEEVRRLTNQVGKRTELVGRNKLPDNSDKPKDPGAPATPPRRTARDLPREIQQQLLQINQVGNPGFGLGADNSNTQFATIALWVARKHGLPVDAALLRVDARFRGSQNADGGWGYMSGEPSVGMTASTTTMTCAGLIGLAVGHGVMAANAKEKNPNAKGGRDIAKDPVLVRGVNALGTSIAHPLAKNFRGKGPRPRHAHGEGKTFYFLWSLERLGVALDLDTIGGKDWFNWGAEILVDNQKEDGSWDGAYGALGADSCFALLFLRRANFAKDLTTNLSGRLKDPGEIVLRSGGAGDLRVPDPGLKPPKDPSATKTTIPGDPLVKEPMRQPALDPMRVIDPKPQVSESARLARELIQATPERQERALESLREGKGTVYTEALAASIPQLEGETRRKARGALAERLARMKDETLVFYLKDEDGEIRRAAALACAMKEASARIPNLIPLLDDPEKDVVRAAHLALKELSGQNLGPAKEDWQAWWDKQPK
jgi:hypothetical protein